MINLTPLQYRGWRLLTGRKTYRDLCDKQWTLSPGGTSVFPAAIYLEKELDKVTGVQDDTSYEQELKRIQGGVREFEGSTAYRLRDVTIHYGYVYKKAMKLTLTTAKESFFESSEGNTIDEAALTCTYCGNRYFSHWLTDDLTLTMAARQFANPVRTAQPLTPHQMEYSNLLNIYSTPVTQAHFKELIVFEDWGQNQSKLERYELIRSQFRSLAPLQSSPGVMILRGNSGAKRSLINEREIAEFLRSQGFTIIEPEKTSAKDIILQSLGAKIVVSVEGSQMVHGLFTLGNGGTLLILQPPFRFNNLFKEYTDCLGLNYSFVVGKQVDDGFEVSLEDLAKTLDIITAKSGDEVAA